MPSDYSIQALLEIAKQAALEAGESILSVYDSGKFESFAKDDNSPVTSADYQANDIITQCLQKETPDIPIMSEETDNGTLAERQHWARYWLIDPIDGTQEFVSRSGDFAVNIALIENHQPVIGVIFWPMGESLYFASKGQGAFKQNMIGTKQIKVRAFRNPDKDVVKIAISRRQSREKVMSRLNAERDYQTLPIGSCSLKACHIAEGKADVFLRIGDTGEWDTGASQCIVSEAGGNLVAANFDPLTYNETESLNNPDFIVMGDQQVDWRRIIK